MVVIVTRYLSNGIAAHGAAVDREHFLTSTRLSAHSGLLNMSPFSISLSLLVRNRSCRSQHDHPLDGCLLHLPLLLCLDTTVALVFLLTDQLGPVLVI
jgi:hypothetical protein